MPLSKPTVWVVVLELECDIEPIAAKATAAAVFDDRFYDFTSLSIDNCFAISLLVVVPYV